MYIPTGILLLWLAKGAWLYEEPDIADLALYESENMALGGPLGLVDPDNPIDIEKGSAIMAYEAADGGRRELSSGRRLDFELCYNLTTKITGYEHLQYKYVCCDNGYCNNIIYQCTSCVSSSIKSYYCHSSSHYGCTTGDCSNRMSLNSTLYAYQHFTHTHDPSDSTVIDLLNNPVTEIIPSGSDDADCPLRRCFQSGYRVWPQPSYSPSKYITFTYQEATQTYLLQYNVTQPFDLVSYLYCDNGYQLTNFHYRRVTVNCGPSSTVVSVPSTIDYNQSYTLGWGRRPYATVPYFDNTEANCVITFTLQDENGNFPSWVDSFSTRHLSYQIVYVSYSLRYKNGPYKFKLVGTAQGGTTSVTTPVITLNTVCNTAYSGYNFSAPTFTSPQTMQREASNVRFEFPEYNQLIEGCYVETYAILQTDNTTVHPDFLNAANVISTKVESTLYAYVSSPLTTKTYDFMIKATARGGASILSGPFQLVVKCIPGSFTVSPETSPLPTYYNRTLEVAGTSKIITFPTIVTSVTYCTVVDYKLDDDNNANTHNAPGGLSIVSAGCSSSPCRDITYVADVEKNYTFYMAVYIEDGSYQYYGPITIEVKCGFETITRNQSSIQRIYSRVLPPNPDPIVESFSSVILTFFTVDLPQCKISTLKLYSDENLSAEITSHPYVSISNTHLLPAEQDLIIKQGTPINETIYLGVITQGYKASSLLLNLFICGHEIMESHRPEVQLYVYWKAEADNNTNIAWTELETYFSFTTGNQSIPECNNETIQFFYDAAYTQPMVNDDRLEVVGAGADHRFHIWVNKAYPLVHLYLLRRSRGQIDAFVPFQIEVCGTEVVTLIDPDSVITLLYFIDTGDDKKKHYIPKSEFELYFQSSSPNCPPTYFELYEFDSVSRSYNPFSSALISMDLEDDYLISIMTKTIYNKWVYVRPERHGSADYLPFNITVVVPTVAQWILDAVNKPPKFKVPVRNEYYFYITKEKYKQQKYVITFAEVEDDKEEFDKLVIDGSDLGSLTYSHTDGTVEYGSPSQIMTYDPEKNQLILDLKSVSDIEPFATNHSVEVTLYDLQEATKSYNTRIAFQLPILVVEEDDEEEEVIEEEFQIEAWIRDISMYGDVEIKFSQNLNEERIDMSWFNDSMINAYIEPANDFHLEQPFDVKQLNFTWSVTNFFADKLILKLDFAYPSWVSSQRTQDTLVIIIKVTPSLFLPSGSTRNLEEALYLKLKLPIIRQMEKSTFNQGVEKSLEQQKDAFKASVIISFLLNQVMSGLMDYLLSMLNSLQIILHLPIMQVGLPSNVMMYMSILIPICLFDILDGQEWYDNLLTQVDEYDSPFINAQVAEIGYSTHNPLLNMGSMFAFMFLYTVKVCLYLVVVSPLSKRCNACLRIKNKQKQLLFYSEILIIIIEGYLEIELSCLLNLNIPFKHEYNTLVNLVFFQGEKAEVNRSFAYFFLILILLVIPCIMVRIIRSDMETLEDPDFKTKWGSIYEHVRYDNPIRRQFYFWFILRRVAFVSITYIFKDLICFQIISVIFLNMFMQIYQGYFSPLHTRFKNQQENFNEFIIYISCLHLITFTAFNPDMDIQTLMGWSFIFFITFGMAVNMSVVCYMMFKRLQVLYRFWKVRFDHRFITIPRRKQQAKQKREQKAEIFRFVSTNLNQVTAKTKLGMNSLKVDTGGRKSLSELKDHEIKKIADDVPDSGMRVRWLSNEYDKDVGPYNVAMTKSMRVQFAPGLDSPFSPEINSLRAPKKDPINIIDDNASFDAESESKIQKKSIISASDFYLPSEPAKDQQTERLSSGFQSFQSSSIQPMALNFKRVTEPAPVETEYDPLPQIQAALGALQSPQKVSKLNNKKRKTSSQKIVGLTQFKQLDTNAGMRVRFRQRAPE